MQFYLFEYLFEAILEIKLTGYVNKNLKVEGIDKIKRFWRKLCIAGSYDLNRGMVDKGRALLCSNKCFSVLDEILFFK